MESLAAAARNGNEATSRRQIWHTGTRNKDSFIFIGRSYYICRSQNHLQSNKVKEPIECDWQEMQSIKSGELSRAARIVSRQRHLKTLLKDWNQTIQIFWGCGPYWYWWLLSNISETVILFKAIKTPRGLGAGPSGWHYEHLHLSWENLLTSGLLLRFAISLSAPACTQSFSFCMW